MSISAAVVSEGDIIYRDVALKRAALLFDHLLVFDYALHTEMPELLMPYQQQRRSKHGAVLLTTLWELGIVHDLYGYGYRFGPEVGADLAAELSVPFVNDLVSDKTVMPSETLPFEEREKILRLAQRNSVLRHAAAIIRNRFQTEAILIDRISPIAGSITSGGTDQVLEIVLEALPCPDELTPWQDILEFRGDPEATGARIRLKNWIRTIAKSHHSAPEIEDALAELLFEYEQHMKLHRIKINRGVLETVVVAAGELAEDMMKLRFGKMAQRLFTLTQRKIALQEAERSAPGREIAYIMMARERFSPRS